MNRRRIVEHVVTHLRFLSSIPPHEEFYVEVYV